MLRVHLNFCHNVHNRFQFFYVLQMAFHPIAPGNMNYPSPSSVSFLCTDLFFLLICIFSSVFPRKAWALNQEEVSGDMAKGDKILLRHHSNEEGVVLALELKALMTKILHGKRKKRYVFYCLFSFSFSLDKVMEIMS